MCGWVCLSVSVCDFVNVILRKSSFCDNVLDFFMLVCAELGWDGEGRGGGRVDFQAVQLSVLRKKGEKMLSCYFLAA